MRALGVVGMKPFVEISLKLLDGFVKLLAECDLIKLLQNCLMEELADAVGLRRLHFGLRVIDVVDGQEQLAIVLVDPTAKFSTAIGHDAQHWKFMLVVKRQHLYLLLPGNGTSHAVELCFVEL